MSTPYSGCSAGSCERHLRCLDTNRTLIDGLLSGQQFDEAIIEMVEAIGLSQVLVQRHLTGTVSTRKMRLIAIDAVADRDIDQAIFARQRNAGFARIWLAEQTRASSAAQN